VSWNYRVIRQTKGVETFLAIHEVYLDSVGNPTAITKEPVEVMGENEDELRWVLDRMREALDRPVLEATQFTDEKTSG
jgi:hypothetical protein